MWSQIAGNKVITWEERKPACLEEAVKWKAEPKSSSQLQVGPLEAAESGQRPSRDTVMVL